MERAGVAQWQSSGIVNHRQKFDSSHQLKIMENSKEIDNFRDRMVLAVCSAGSDRSKYIADVLNNRGYIASNGGVLENYNYVTTDDLRDIGSIIFASKHEQAQFNKIKHLNDAVKRNKIKVSVMNITESDKNRAIYENRVSALKKRISEQLDELGFKDLIESSY